MPASQFWKRPAYRKQPCMWGRVPCHQAMFLGAADLDGMRTTCPCTPNTTWADRSTAHKGDHQQVLRLHPALLLQHHCSVSAVLHLILSACSLCSAQAPVKNEKAGRHLFHTQNCFSFKTRLESVSKKFLQTGSMPLSSPLSPINLTGSMPLSSPLSPINLKSSFFYTAQSDPLSKSIYVQANSKCFRCNFVDNV